MTFITKTNHPISFIPTDVLIVSKRLMTKKITQYRQEIRESTDEDFIKGRKEKIALLKLITSDLKEIIQNIGS